MERTSKWGLVGLITTLLAIIIFFSANIGGYERMNNYDYTLKTYTGVGSGVYKHGTIVKIVDGQPVVIGHFDDDSGKEFPGTVVLEETK